MTNSLLAYAAVVLVAALLALLVLGARWKQARTDLTVAYASACCAVGYSVGEWVWVLPSLHLWVGTGLMMTTVIAVLLLRRSWNPAAQTFLGALVLTCGVFVVLAAQFAFGGALPLAARITSMIFLALEMFAFLLLIISTHEVL